MTGKSKGLSVKKAVEILNCDQSYIYKLVKKGELEVAQAKPKTTITPESIINRICSDYPYLKNCYSSIHYNINQAVQPSW